MQYLYFLLLVAMCQGLSVYEVRARPLRVKPLLPQPVLLGLTALDPPGLQVQWKRVNDVPGLGPIKGYKVLVWELRPVKVKGYEIVEGFDTLMKGYRPPKLSDTGTLSEEDAMTIVVSDPLISQVNVPNIKLNSIYEVRVRAFTESKDGPLSTHLSIQLLDKKNSFGKA